jgi:diguanylate cyclase (GGDEF)-like protein/PAS domain S-box-containing protein
MTDTNPTETQNQTEILGDSSIQAVEIGQQRVRRLLAGLQKATPSTMDSSSTKVERFENELALVRLGMAASLFYALRTKHAPTAAHCLRVAISCSAWAERLGLDDATRDRVEVAALLHDVGKIGIPDRILRKPGKLTVDEQLIMDRSVQHGLGILRGCTTDTALLDIFFHANSWYEGRRDTDGPTGKGLPLGSRMLGIADAFDSMTTDSVYRRAMSRERAIQQLINCSCKQFDPELALDFNHMLEDRPEMLQGAILNRWLQQLQKESSNSFWFANPAADDVETSHSDNLFYKELVSHLHDAVVFTDSVGTIGQWNTMMEKLTGMSANSILGQTWSNECIRLREQDTSRKENGSLVDECLNSGQIISRSMIIERPGSEPIPVHVQAMPVTGPEPGIYGTTLIFRDLSDQTNLEEKLESLHQQTTTDILTGVSNRAHFNSVLEDLTAKACKGGPCFSLIICDIDHFKRVNDVHGHPAGDEALISFATVLSVNSRDDDLVARYGGEEFLVLAAKCDNATAAGRAETMRQAVENTPISSLGGEVVTASFGVTEFQAGDTHETVLSRADRALLKAKDNGRNRVIQLGSGSLAIPRQSAPKRGWKSWFNSQSKARENEFDIVTSVPVDLAIEKLRGFIADHQAEIINVDENHVSLRLNAISPLAGRRRADQQISLRVEMTLSEVAIEKANAYTPSKTNVHISLQPIRNRDRRNAALTACFEQVRDSLKSYLMGQILDNTAG